MNMISRPFLTLVSVVLIFNLCPVEGYALSSPDLTAIHPLKTESTPDNAPLASGTWGTCLWELTNDGTLTVHPGTGEDTEESPWHQYKELVKHVVFKAEDGKKVIAPQSCSHLLALSWFSNDDQYMQDLDMGDGRFIELSYYASNVESIDLSGLDTSGVDDMSMMFYGCSALESLDLSPLDTSQVTTMRHMFDQCVKLKTLDLSGFDTSNVRNTSAMFNQCDGLEAVDLSAFDTSSVTDSSYMFAWCPSLSHVGLSNWDTSNLEYMNAMFEQCVSLPELDLSKWQMPKMRKIAYAFSGCYALRELDLSGLGSVATGYEYEYGNKYSMEFNAFSECYSLQKLTLGPSFVLEDDTDLRDGSWKNAADGRVFTTKGLVQASANGGVGGTWEYVKSKNPLTAKAKKGSFTVSASKLKVKSRSIKKPISVKNAKGSISYAKASKGKKLKGFKVNSKTGTVKVPKGAKKGIYKLRVTVKAKGNDVYKPATKTISLRIKVR